MPSTLRHVIFAERLLTNDADTGLFRRLGIALLLHGERLMNGPCAKVQVLCTIITEDGQRFTGTNECRNPQAVCPRAPGEGYEKCKSVCDQVSHAERAAIRACVLGGGQVKHSTAYVEYAYVCDDCKQYCANHWVNVVIGAPCQS